MLVVIAVPYASSKGFLLWGLGLTRRGWGQAAFRKNAMAMLTTKLKAAMQKENDAATSELDRLFEQQRELNCRQEKLASAVQSMQVLPQPCVH